MLHIGNGFYINKDIAQKLYDYQRDGVSFLFKLFKEDRGGGILGDDMGLGKTVQVASFLSGMFDSERIRTVLIVLPPVLITNWEEELHKWCPGIDVYKYHQCTQREKVRLLTRVQCNGGVCLTTYNTIMNSYEELSKTHSGKPFTWDYCILDEGHKIKNAYAKTAKAVHGIMSKHRVLLTGTPIMNNLKELWSQFDWTHQGQLLGTLKTFGDLYEGPIIRARQKDASAQEKIYGELMSNELNQLINPFLLRRLKSQVVRKEGSNAPQLVLMPKMTRKNDFICWLRISEEQMKIYKAFLSSEEVKLLLQTTRSPLVALTTLKKICDHPRLFSNKKCNMLGVSEGSEGLVGLNNDEDADETFNVSTIPDSILLNECGKMEFLVQLLQRLKQEGHRCLVFSLSRRILDIIQKIVTNLGHKVCRLDGTIKLMAERQQIINKFQNNPGKYDIFLLTTKVAGVGLTLTAADRVIIYDPSWNPATDSQAVDRAYRIGQTKNVVIYRSVVMMMMVMTMVMVMMMIRDAIDVYESDDDM
ncbi:hypothetical protein HELRODRAFT_81620 [Helobdella robusta]|uniref:Helicase ATP-binding domain-containing protein n=1 Tax=Helobdella robusta TaxID=6412 RepID=T1G4G6_HELRO|nr:hypothetical protein HELRODRAFT_81620 [Helobdella robusta]ESO01553.1 hypothetical protein HELRODRAFT_81620 [Helobdella robusta]